MGMVLALGRDGMLKKRVSRRSLMTVTHSGSERVCVSDPLSGRLLCRVAFLGTWRMKMLTPSWLPAQQGGCLRLVPVDTEPRDTKQPLPGLTLRILVLGKTSAQIFLPNFRYCSCKPESQLDLVLRLLSVFPLKYVSTVRLTRRVGGMKSFHIHFSCLQMEFSPLVDFDFAMNGSWISV